jgi:large repetitive protein
MGSSQLKLAANIGVLLFVSTFLVQALVIGPNVVAGQTQASEATGANGLLAAFTYEFACTTCAISGFPTLLNASWSASTTGTIVLYTWNFGDGFTTQTANPSTVHNYQSLGPNNAGWQAALTVKDSDGLTDTANQTVTPDAIPRFTFQPSSPSAGQPITLDGSSSRVYGNSNTTVAFSWSFGDGTSASGTVVNHAYSAAGLYRVTSTFLNVYGKSQVSKTVLVASNPSVGGSLVPTDKLVLLAPYLGLAAAIALGTVGASSFLRRLRPRKNEK